ncbi:hypothetical protein SDC9_126613 [bioreactor metagenome]|uniref:Uncharacterized protein n=1 Tax=bioreactor metagenome TaxID=1076179 RepID=A0A645CRQ1_9ZZZZ
MNQPRGRVDHKRRTADDQAVRARDIPHCALNRLLIKALLIKHNIRPDNAAAAAAGDIVLRVNNRLQRIRFTAVHTVIAVHRTVQLIDLFAAGELVQPVDVLRHNR